MKKLIIASALLGAAALPLSVLASPQVNNPCIGGSGTCSGDVNETIVAGKGVEDLAWTGGSVVTFDPTKAYVCEVAYLNQAAYTGNFVVKNGAHGRVGESITLTETGQQFDVTPAAGKNLIGFTVDGSSVTGPGSNGPQVTLVCYDKLAPPDNK